jgi:hypothetical protein
MRFVTAFLDLHEDRSKDKSPEHCLTLFSKLAATGISIHLFLSKKYQSTFPENVTVEYIELEDLTTYKEIADIEYAMPANRTPHHDTNRFMILMNSKIELVHRAIRPEYTNYAWIDFSIFHVFRDPSTSDYLKMLGSSLLRNGLFIPGCWYKGAGFNAVNWRFCGGFFTGDTASIELFHSFYRRTFQNIVRAHGLSWEVNVWAYLESKCGWRPIWYKADHNDTIIVLPGDAMRVVATLTTIPPREKDCRLAIDSLLRQVDHVYLSTSNHYTRFGAWTIPDYFHLEPYASHVTVLTGEDHGPATKYLGAIQQIPANTWVFVCDDDQEYHPNLLKRMLDSVRKLALYQNHFESIKQKTSGGMVHGYVGMLIHSSFLSGLERFPLPSAAQFVDDQWMSIYCFRNNIPIENSGVEEYRDIFRVLDGWHEKIGADGLAGLGGRAERVSELERALAVRFCGWQVENCPI